MSIGKSSIARAVSATNTTKTQIAVNSTNTISNFSINNIDTLAIAKTHNNIEKIKKSIAKRGILCPVLVAATAKGDVWLIDGYCRIAAARELGINQIKAIVINVDTKRDANNIYIELCAAKAQPVNSDIHEEKFHVLCVKDHDLPAYLL